VSARVIAVVCLVGAGHATACVEIDPAFYDDATGTGASTTGDTAAASTGASGPSAITCDDLDPAVVFCTDFEEGHLDQWDDYDDNVSVDNVLALDPGARDADDNHVMRLRVAPGPDAVDLVKLLPGYYDRLYTRWYIKYETAYDLSRPGLGSGLHAGARDLLGVSDALPAGDDRFSVLTTHTPTDPQPAARLDYRGQYQDCPDPAMACFRDTLPCLQDPATCSNPAHRTAPSTPALRNDQWYCVEMSVDAGTAVDDAALADGVLELWVDGASAGRWDDLWFRTDDNLKLNVLWLLLYYGGDHGDEGVLYDDVVVSRERIGCL
jgi:hypothetical protein